jgi:solute carrier family 30 (zinc transporter), member 2
MVEKSGASKNYPLGTPISSMHPTLTFQQVLEKNMKIHDQAMKKLIIVSIVSVFFITA